MQDNSSTAGSGDHRLAIGVLSITATVLLVGVLVVSLVNNRALATGQNDRGGDYIMLGVQFTDSVENVVVTDAAQQRINVYQLDRTSYRMNIWSEFDLQRLKAQRPGPNVGRR